MAITSVDIQFTRSRSSRCMSPGTSSSATRIRQGEFCPPGLKGRAALTSQGDFCPPSLKAQRGNTLLGTRRRASSKLLNDAIAKAV